MSTQQDADKFLDFIRSCFVEVSDTKSGVEIVSESETGGAKVGIAKSEMGGAKVEMGGAKVEVSESEIDGAESEASDSGEVKVVSKLEMSGANAVVSESVSLNMTA